MFFRSVSKYSLSCCALFLPIPSTSNSLSVDANNKLGNDLNFDTKESCKLSGRPGNLARTLYPFGVDTWSKGYIYNRFPRVCIEFSSS